MCLYWQCLFSCLTSCCWLTLYDLAIMEVTKIRWVTFTLPAGKGGFETFFFSADEPLWALDHGFWRRLTSTIWDAGNDCAAWSAWSFRIRLKIQDYVRPPLAVVSHDQLRVVFLGIKFKVIFVDLVVGKVCHIGIALLHVLTHHDVLWICAILLGRFW